jgi:HD superfamily phosphohydrolase YqeK
MEKHEFFRHEIQLIESEDLRSFVRWFFDEKVGEWFWKSGASSSGKYHPQFTKGEGGLVKHTRAVVMVCDELLRMSSYAYMKAEYKDYAIIACLLHDTRKYGSGDAEDKECYAQHGKLAADAVFNAWLEFFDQGEAPELLLMAIRSHMGQWVEDKEDRPFTNIDRLVHLSDYIASRPFWDIPQLNQEYTADRNTEYFSQHPDEAAAFGFAL